MTIAYNVVRHKSSSAMFPYCKVVQQIDSSDEVIIEEIKFTKRMKEK